MLKVKYKEEGDKMEPEKSNKNITNTITLMIEKKRIYQNQDCYRKITRREWIVAKFILREIYELNESIVKSKLYLKVKKKFNEMVLRKIAKYEGEENKITAIKKSKFDYWIYHRDRNSKKYRKSFLTSKQFSSVVDYLVPSFIFLKTVGIKGQKRGMSHVLVINQKGKDLIEKWDRKKQTEVKKNV